MNQTAKLKGATKGNPERAILLSVKPMYASGIVDGIKTIELRKAFPIDMPKGTKIYIYSSSPEQKVIGECKISYVKEYAIDELWREVIDKALIGWEEFTAYFQGHKTGFAIAVEKPARYNQPIPLGKSSFHDINHPPQSYRYMNNATMS